MKAIVASVIGAVAFLFGMTVIFGSWYTVDQTERGVILRNGAVVGTAALLGISGWLMGLPPGFLASACLTSNIPEPPSTPRKRASRPRATPSSRKFPKPLAEAS